MLDNQVVLVVKKPSDIPDVYEANTATSLHASYVLDIPAGSDAFSVAVAFVQGENLPIGTEVYVFQPKTFTDPSSVTHWRLDSNWTQLT